MVTNNEGRGGYITAFGRGRGEPQKYRQIVKRIFIMALLRGNSLGICLFALRIENNGVCGWQGKFIPTTK